MIEITYSEETPQDEDAVVALYDNAGWTAYSQQPAKLMAALAKSRYVLVARAQSRLVGLIRAVGDDVSITYIQDLLVHTDYKRRGIGTSLMVQTLERFSHCRQKVLLTDDDPETRCFYESLGFQSCDQGQLVAYVRLEN